ncbi:MAG TPA: dTMP kinase [Rhizomicrobium sp.]|nr:dTMP kinase [Rhizomicrobium sp.]
MTPGFITLEGGEGAGKSTQARKLAAMIESKGFSCLTTREPGGSPGAEQIRKLLVEGEPGRWDALTETLLLFAARADHVAHAIRPALEARRFVVCDRFTDSTYAYQGAGRGTPRETIRRIESIVLEDFKPDLTIVLDLPSEMGLKRAMARGAGEGRFEKFDSGFHERLRQAFLDIARRSPDRCVVVDASASEQEVARAVWDAAARRFGL